MTRAIVVRAVACIVVGAFLILAGAAGPAPNPEPVRSYRPATEQERRDQDRRLLEDELDRLWEQRQR